MADGTNSKMFIVSGMVQGVGYRYYAQRTARTLGIRGFARNMNDGRVEIYAIGAPEALASFRAALEHGPRSATVERIEEHEFPLDARYSDSFTIEQEDW